MHDLHHHKYLFIWVISCLESSLKRHKLCDCCGKQANSALKMPYPNPQNLGIYYVTWQGRIRLADRSEVVNEWADGKIEKLSKIIWVGQRKSRGSLKVEEVSKKVSIRVKWWQKDSSGQGWLWRWKMP